MIKVSRELAKLNTSIERARAYLTQQLYKEPSDMEIALFLEVDYKQVEEAQMANKLVESLDQDYEMEEEFSLYDTVGYQEPMFDEDLLDLGIQLDKLDHFDRELINQRYSLERTQSETSEILGISQGQVSRKEKEILQD